MGKRDQYWNIVITRAVFDNDTTYSVVKYDIPINIQFGIYHNQIIFPHDWHMISNEIEIDRLKSQNKNFTNFIGNSYRT